MENNTIDDLNSGKLTNEIDEVVKSLDELKKATSDVADVATKSLDKVEQKASEVASGVSDASKPVQELSVDFGKLGSEANTALGVIAASIKDTNPALASTLGSVQKLIPNLVNVAQAAKKCGSALKAMTSVDGIMLLINLIATLITDFDNIMQTLGVTQDQLDSIYETFAKYFPPVMKWIGAIGNILLQKILAPFRMILTLVKDGSAAFKQLFSGDFKGAAKTAGDAVSNMWKIFKDSWNLKDQFKTGAEWGENVAKGILNRKKKVADAGKEVGDAAAEAFAKAFENLRSELQSLVDELMGDLKADIEKYWDKRGLLDDALASGLISDARYQELLQKLDDQFSDLDLPDVELDFDDEGLKKSSAAVTKAIEDIKKKQEEQDKAEADAIEKKKKSYASAATAMADLYSNVADIIEDNVTRELEAGKISEKEAQRKFKAAKALRITTATIDTIQGAVTAFATAMELGPIAGPIVGAINAAAVTASGIAQIAKIKNSSIGSSSNLSASVPKISVPAPQVYSAQSPQDIHSDQILSELRAQTSAMKETNTVLVVEDLNQVQGRVDRVKTQSQF